MLNLNDLTKIRKTFSRIIIGMYHPRIEYPSSDLNPIIDVINKTPDTGNALK
jgi:hypothetical protein